MYSLILSITNDDLFELLHWLIQGDLFICFICYGNNKKEQHSSSQSCDTFVS